MKKIILELEDSEVKKDDIIIYNGKYYTVISRNAFLSDLNDKLYNLSQKLENSFKRLENIEKQMAYDHGEVDEL